MQDQYQRLNQPQSTQTRAALFSALTARMQDYIFDQQRQRQQVVSSSKFKRPAFIVDQMDNSFIDLKKSFQYVGDNSKFQKRITTVLMIQWIAFSYMVNSMAFLFRSPNYSCRIPLTDIWIPCHARQACQFIHSDFVRVNFENSSWFNLYQISITEQFGLICQNKGWAPFAQSMFFLGGFISGYLFSYISSKIGRRSMLLLISIMSACSILVCAFAVNFRMFLVGYFFVGFTLFGYETNVYIYIGQISAIRFRTISINMLTMVWAGTPLFLPILNLIPSWKYAFIFFASIIMCTLPFSYNFFLQSPIFLVSKKCYSQAREVFCKISTTNNRPPYTFKLLEEIEFENNTYLRDAHGDAMHLIHFGLTKQRIIKQYNFFDLFKFSSLRKITLVLMYWWMFRFFMYFGLNLALESILHSGLVLSMVIAVAAIVQVLGSFGITLMTTILYNKYKLDIMKICLLMTTFCCGAMWFLTIKIQCKNLNKKNYQLCSQLILMIILVIIIKFFNTVFFSGLIGYYSEVFPTPIRSIGCGFTLTFGRLGTIIVPFYINYMKIKYTQKNSLSFLAPFGLIAFLLCFFMPYTELGVRQTIEQQQKQEIQLKFNF